MSTRTNTISRTLTLIAAAALTTFASTAAMAERPTDDATAPTFGPARTVAEVQAELAQARREGRLVEHAELGLTTREEYPQNYSADVRPVKTPAQVRNELLDAIRTGDVIGNNESGLKLNEMYPRRYAPAKVMPRTGG